jgi:hypothetical protein
MDEEEELNIGIIGQILRHCWCSQGGAIQDIRCSLIASCGPIQDVGSPVNFIHIA